VRTLGDSRESPAALAGAVRESGILMAMRVRFGSCVFDSAAHTLERAGLAIDLTPKAFSLLELLVRAAPAAVEKEQLYRALWPDVVVEMGNLHNLIAEVRSGIGDASREMLRTVHRVGYAFAADLVEVSASSIHLVLGTRVIALVEGENVIGRELTGTRDVSRRHALIVVQGSSAILTDLDSKNGTWMGTTPIHEPVELADGDAITFGQTHTIIRFDGPDASTITAIPQKQ
jgi:DNA-binding winged helix-turn-helix (wHTH) protein